MFFRPAGTFCAAALLLAGSPQTSCRRTAEAACPRFATPSPYGRYTAGLGYTRFVGRRTSVSTGVSLSSYSATAQLDGVTFSSCGKGFFCFLLLRGGAGEAKAPRKKSKNHPATESKRRS